MGLIQRALEQAGIPTVSLTNQRAATERLLVPRAVEVRFPRGAVFGEPGNRDKQLAVLRDTLARFEQMDAPGAIATLPYRWRPSA